MTAARGTTHDVPSARGCQGCHAGVASGVLGFSAIPHGSEVVRCMRSREPGTRMPALGSARPDDARLAQMTAWIQSLR